MWELIDKGGFMMYPIILSSVVALAVVVERLIVFSKIRPLSRESMDEMVNLLEKNGADKAIKHLENEKSPVSDFYKVILMEKNEELSEKAAAAKGEDILFILNRKLTLLSVIGSLVPLMGLLGTVVGMIKVFSRVAAAGDMSDISILAGGIWEALMTTAAGMAVSIPVLMAYHYFSRNVEKRGHSMSQYGDLLVAAMRKAGIFS